MVRLDTRIAPPKIPNICCQPQSISAARRQLSKFDLTYTPFQSQISALDSKNAPLVRHVHHDPDLRRRRHFSIDAEPVRQPLPVPPLITACAAVSLLGSPIALLLIGFVYFLWLILYFFREDPLLVWGHHVSDWAVILGIVLISIVAFWITGPLNSLSIGVGLGLFISVVHGVLRNPEGLFLDENDAVSNGLIVSTSKPTASGIPSGGIPFSPPV
ncbi:prenylated rab acceptor family protein [Striga asiatica]|uniref:PRA1 family protein n=1 Tax=Striga asiatica TaxID=4170 RepID=A0A5A7R4P6_STRAF|nr:prenylated rab acceptor family protein [Striga asiatica]